ncbi:hypothetical protein Peur_033246 [Populus x canadensis]
MMHGIHASLSLNHLFTGRKEHHHFEKSIVFRFTRLVHRARQTSDCLFVYLLTPRTSPGSVVSMLVNEVRCSLTNAFRLSCSRVEPLLHRCQRS